MAKIGMRKPRVYPFASSMNGMIPDSGEVTYESSSVSLGKAVSGTLNENRTSSDLYADDSMAEHVEDFTGGTFEATVDDLDPETRGKVLGASISAVDASKGEVGYGADEVVKNIKARMRLELVYSPPNLRARGRLSDGAG